MAEIIDMVKSKVELGRFRSMIMIDSRGMMLTPAVILKDINKDYEQIVFLRYLDQNSFG
jgi:hypothetical protein